MDKELQNTTRSLTSRAKVLRRTAGPIAALAACALLLVLLNGLSRGLDYHGVTQALRATPHRLVWISILLTAVSYLALVARDLCALSYVGVQVSTPALLLASFCGSALGNAISFKALTADAVRDRVYGAVGVRPEQTARVMLFINVAFGIGLAAFAALSLMLAGNAIAHLLPVSITSIRCAGAAALLAILLALLLRSWRRQPVTIGRLSIEMPSLTITLLQLVASAIDLGGGGCGILVPAAARTDRLLQFRGSVFGGNRAGSDQPGSRRPRSFRRRHLPRAETLCPSQRRGRCVADLSRRVLRAAATACRSLIGGVGTEERAGPFWLESRGTCFAGSRTARADFSKRRSPSRWASILVVSGATPALDWRLAALQGVLPLWAVEISHLLATLAGVLSAVRRARLISSARRRMVAGADRRAGQRRVQSGQGTRIRRDRGNRFPGMSSARDAPPVHSTCRVHASAVQAGLVHRDCRRHRVRDRNPAVRLSRRRLSARNLVAVRVRRAGVQVAASDSRRRRFWRSAFRSGSCCGRRPAVSNHLRSETCRARRLSFAARSAVPRRWR